MMVRIQNVICPYCKANSFFGNDVDSGYCSSCGKIIYADHKEVYDLDVQSTVNKYPLTMTYLRKQGEYNKTLIVTINGPQSRQLALNKDEPISIDLPEGQYQIVANCHVDAGVNSTDVLGSIMVEMNKRHDLTIVAKGLFRREIEMILI